MTDDFKDLSAALHRVPPADPAARAAAIALAMQNFDALQEMPPAPRSTSRPARRGVLTGARNMLKSLTSRPILAATTSVAALAFGLALILPVAQIPRPTPSPDLAASTLSDTTSGKAARESPADPVVADIADTADTAARSRTEATAESLPAPASPTAQANPRGVTFEVFGRFGYSGGPAITDAEQDLGHSAPPVPDTEAFANEDPGPVRITAESPVSTFSIDVDTASYAVIRSSLTAGRRPDPAAVRIEEMINYFPYAYPAPPERGAGTDPFRASIATLTTPWNPDTKLVRIALQGRRPALADRPALNLVFLIDTSGSMEDANKLPLLKQSLRLLLGQLRPEDQVAIVAYAGSAGEVLPPTPASDSARILTALDNLAAKGATAGAGGLALAYRIAGGMTAEGEVSRILLATDGDFNLGVSDPAGLRAYVARNRDTAYLSVLGFGRGNLDDATMQALAQNGNGTAAYIDTLAEAQKTLVDQLSGAFFPIADDVKIQVEWNPARVAEYRLIGYETRSLARQDFNADSVDAGEIGAGHQVTALYEITAPGSPALRSDPLRYGTAAPGPADTSTGTGTGTELGFLRLRYKSPGAAASTLLETPIADSATDPATAADARFAAAIAGFGQLLQFSPYLNGWGWDQAIALATANRGDDPFGYRAEAVTLMRLAQGLSAQ